MTTERRRLAGIGQRLGRQILAEVATIVTRRTTSASRCRHFARTRDKSPYSTRSAIIGSTRAARCPGTRTATSETMTINTTTAT
jgi:hypothetical protein